MTCELPTDSQITQVTRCHEVIDKQRRDGPLVVAFAFRPASKGKRKETEPAYSGNSLSGRCQSCRKQNVRNKIWNGNEYESGCQFKRGRDKDQRLGSHG